ncbi:hypothetical protein ACNVED_02170 [Legionella sp. D16C41]|uniref:hypothetical protein n=1 Tax=Legionella sp. D16C41 TaxID=3402688 RepID=UPI003AF70C53
MKPASVKPKTQDKIVIGCGNNCKDSVLLQGVRLPQLDHKTLHPPNEFLTMNLPGSQYNPDIECSLDNPKLSSLFPTIKFSQIILEHIPPVAVNKQAIINLSYLLEDQGVCLAVLSRYLGRSIAHIGLDFYSGLIAQMSSSEDQAVKYQRGDYEFFNNLQLAGFKTVLFLDDTGLNFLLFKLDLIKAKVLFNNLIKKKDYFSKICKKQLLIEDKNSPLIWGSIDNIILKSQLYLANFVKAGPDQLKELLEPSSAGAGSSTGNDIVDTIGILGSKNLINSTKLKEFIYSYNTAFETVLLSKNNIVSLVTILEQIQRERDTLNYTLLSMFKSVESSLIDLEYLFLNNLINNLLYFSSSTKEGILRACLDLKKCKEDVCELIYVKFRKEIKQCLISIIGDENTLQALLNDMQRIHTILLC